MSNTGIGQSLLLSLFMLVACEPAEKIVARQYVVEWPEEHLQFVADSRVGRVQSYRMGVGAPVLLAQTQGIRRSGVRDIRLDPQRNQLWVLGSHGVYLYEARGLVLQKQFLLDGPVIWALRSEAGRVGLVDRSGGLIGQIDSETLVASWSSAYDRG